MQLPFLTQPGTVQRFAASAQAKSAAVLDFTVGSVWLALSEAVAAIVLWLQYLCILILGTTRAATSNGSDLDSFYADFFFAREPAVPASGTVTLSRNSAAQAALVVPGAQIKTTDGTQIFTVTTDTSNPAWSTFAGATAGYFVPAGLASVTVPVVDAVAGSAGNIQAGTLTLLASNLPGIDNATNASAFTNGLDAESDTAFRARFQIYIAGLATGNAAAIVGAAEAVQQGVRTQLRNNYPGPGFYTLYADDGSGAAPNSFIAAVTAAVQAVTSEGVQPAVLRPTLIPAGIIAGLQINPAANRPTVVANVGTALADFVAGLPIGGTLPYLQLPSVIFGADPNVTGLASLSINGGAADVVAGEGGLIQATVSVS